MARALQFHNIIMFWYYNELPLVTQQHLFVNESFFTVFEIAPRRFVTNVKTHNTNDKCIITIALMIRVN